MTGAGAPALMKLPKTARLKSAPLSAIPGTMSPSLEPVELPFFTKANTIPTPPPAGGPSYPLIAVPMIAPAFVAFIATPGVEDEVK
jgi:hypothetical protein